MINNSNNKRKKMSDLKKVASFPDVPVGNRMIFYPLRGQS
jgi:hypothetical protein